MGTYQADEADLSPEIINGTDPPTPVHKIIGPIILLRPLAILWALEFYGGPYPLHLSGIALSFYGGPYLPINQ